MAGAPASTLRLLEELPSVPPGEKVRVLGCVLALSPSAAAPQHLTLVSEYPVAATPASTPTPAPAGDPPGRTPAVRVVVDIALARDSPGCAARDCSVGSWLNVIGYVTRSAAAPALPPTTAHLQALLLWPARGRLPALRTEYETAVLQRRRAAAAIAAAREIYSPAATDTGTSAAASTSSTSRNPPPAFLAAYAAAAAAPAPTD